MDEKKAQVTGGSNSGWFIVQSDKEMRFVDAPRDSLSLNQNFKLRFSKLTDIARENNNFPMGE